MGPRAGGEEPDGSLERELKLAVDDDFRLPDLAGALPGVTAHPAGARSLRAVYWDAPDLRIARGGGALRHRNDEGWLVKLDAGSEGDLLRRGEWAFAGPPDAPPPPALELLRPLLLDARVVPAVRLHTRRTPVELRREDGQPLAEVVLDEVAVHAGGRVRSRFREVEVELRSDAPPGLLAALVARLRAAGAGAVRTTPKHVRALAALGAG